MVGMAITPENIVAHELIGLQVRMAESLCLPRKGLNGVVVDETKNTLVIRTEKGVERVIPKKGSLFSFTLPDGKRCTVAGERIAFRPSDRPKKVKRE